MLSSFFLCMRITKKPELTHALIFPSHDLYGSRCCLPRLTTIKTSVTPVPLCCKGFRDNSSRCP
jgi:hypothetical protein